MKKILFVLLCSILICSCATKTLTNTEYKEVPVLIHDTLILKLFSHDTTIVRDSIVIQLKGDTIFYTKYKDSYKTKYVHDTLNKVVQVPVEVVKSQIKTVTQEVNILYWWQKTLMYLGILSLILVGVLLYIKYKK